MAKMNGFELKGIKTWQGMEGEGFQGSVYYNGKKVGFISDYGDGAMMDITLPRELHALVSKGEFMDDEIFFGKLYALHLQEKGYKQMVKRGLPFVAFVLRQYDFLYVGSNTAWSLERFNAYMAMEMPKEGYKEDEVHLNVDERFFVR